MIESDIWDAFSTAVTAFAGDFSPPIQVIHQGVNGTPPDSGTWLETRFFPNETQNYGLADAGPSVHQGFCQVTVCERPGTGIIGGLEVSEALITEFAKGAELGPARVERKPWVSSVLQMPDRAMYPITVRYVARL